MKMQKLIYLGQMIDGHTWISGQCLGIKILLDSNRETRLWCESLRPINIDWLGLQNIFRQQYSKIGNTREQLFHNWRSFHFNKNVETIDAYVHCIRQVTLLGYQEPQLLEVFKNTLLTNYTGFFSQ